MSNKRIVADCEKWVPPDSEEVSSVVRSVGGINDACRITRKNRNTVVSWIRGDRKIDYANFKLLRGIKK